jgi:sigma-B regulation protein RsbU (phosphoserine phosphatase)
MQATADQMGLALENVRLYEKLEESYRSLNEAKQAAEAYSKALDEELEKGRKIQKDFLPSEIPKISDWQIEACFFPAIQVAGDFYDVFKLPGKYLGLVIADVCDKGVGSSLYMALLRSLIRIFSGQTALSGLKIGREESTLTKKRKPKDSDQIRPLQAIALTNHYLMQNHEKMGMFATIFFGVLNPATGSLAYINAGHLPPIIVGNDGIKKVLDATGPFVGLMPNIKFRISHAQIDPDEIFIGYTDGVTEATSADLEIFTKKRLEKIVTECNKSAADMISHIRAKLSEFTGNVPQSDDITILAVRREK